MNIVSNIEKGKYKKKEKNILIICHNAITRVILTYFLELDLNEMPYLKINLNNLYILESKNGIFNKKIIEF